MISKYAGIVGSCAVEQFLPRVRGLRFIEIEHVSPSRIFHMERMQYRVGKVNELFIL